MAKGDRNSMNTLSKGFLAVEPVSNVEVRCTALLGASGGVGALADDRSSSMWGLVLQCVSVIALAIGWAVGYMVCTVAFSARSPPLFAVSGALLMLPSVVMLSNSLESILLESSRALPDGSEQTCGSLEEPMDTSEEWSMHVEPPCKLASFSCKLSTRFGRKVNLRGVVHALGLISLMGGIPPIHYGIRFRVSDGLVAGWICCCAGLILLLCAHFAGRPRRLGSQGPSSKQ